MKKPGGDQAKIDTSDLFCGFVSTNEFWAEERGREGGLLQIDITANTEQQQQQASRTNKLAQ